jgi:hypothetical protein
VDEPFAADLARERGLAAVVELLQGKQNIGSISVLTRDRCYDFLNIFGEKFSENIGVFCSNYC